MNRKAKPRASSPKKESKQRSTQGDPYKADPALAKGTSVAIVYRTDKPLALELAQNTAQWLSDRGHQVYSAPGQQISNRVKPLQSKDISKLGLVVVLGGDGTYLRAVRMLGGATTPILGVNLGSLGFLTGIRQQDLYSTLEASLEGRLELRPRSMLQIQVKRNGGKSTKAAKSNDMIESHIALNDVVIERGSNSHLMNLELWSQKHLVFSVKADGLIIASPTGSTAYNLAAGGPILHPNVAAFVVTPICAHSLTHRPMIFSDNVPLTVKIRGTKHFGQLTVDGQSCGDVEPSDAIVITRYKHDHYVVRASDHDYFSLLREKLNFGRRE